MNIEQSPKPKRKGSRGRKREKEQLSVRLDAATLRLAKAFAQDRSLKITDVIEHGVLLEVTQGLKEIPITTQARFFLQHVPAELQRLTLSFWSFLRIPEAELSEIEWRIRQRMEEDLCAWRDGDLRRYRLGLDSYAPEDNSGLELCQRQALKGASPLPLDATGKS
jgi:hypothetical protein